MVRLASLGGLGHTDDISLLAGVATLWAAGVTLCADLATLCADLATLCAELTTLFADLATLFTGVKAVSVQKQLAPLCGVSTLRSGYAVTACVPALPVTAWLCLHTLDRCIHSQVLLCFDCMCPCTPCDCLTLSPHVAQVSARRAAARLLSGKLGFTETLSLKRPLCPEF